MAVRVEGLDPFIDSFEDSPLAEGRERTLAEYYWRRGRLHHAVRSIQGLGLSRQALSQLLDEYKLRFNSSNGRVDPGGQEAVEDGFDGTPILH